MGWNGPERTGNGHEFTQNGLKTDMNRLEMDLNGLETAEIALSLDRNQLQRGKKEMKPTRKIQNEQKWFEKKSRHNCNRFKRDLKTKYLLLRKCSKN